MIEPHTIDHEPVERNTKAVSILVVDDDAVFRGAVKRILEREEAFHVVGEASDGEEAIRLARELHPEVVLMDIRMPRLDGLKATKEIKATQPETKVIILTVHAEEVYRRAAGRSGADALLPKKGFKDVLISRIREIQPPNQRVG